MEAIASWTSAEPPSPIVSAQTAVDEVDVVRRQHPAALAVPRQDVRLVRDMLRGHVPQGRDGAIIVQIRERQGRERIHIGGVGHAVLVGQDRPSDAPAEARVDGHGL